MLAEVPKAQDAIRQSLLSRQVITVILEGLNSTDVSIRSKLALLDTLVALLSR